MKVSYSWLQKYFKEKIPAPEKLAELFTFHSFEVESYDSSMLDVKILPDRNPYCLSHRGIARELHAITGAEYAPIAVPEVAMDSSVLPFPLVTPTKDVSTEIILRYMGRRVENVKVGESPEWLKKELENCGVRSINNIVDILNYVMLDIGQPMHAFDAGKIEGQVVARSAQEGESFTTLDGKEIKLQTGDHVLTDEKGPLAILGVKGGKRAEVTSETKNILIESANFQPTFVRKTSMRIGIRNDSSKRFENGITSALAPEAIQDACAMIAAIIPEAKFGPVLDIEIKPEVPVTFSLLQEFLNKTIGVAIPERDVVEILQRLDIGVKVHNATYELTIPSYRLDLRIPADIADEVGRIWGYEKLPATLPPALNKSEEINSLYFHAEKIKDILVAQGFSEVYSYSLVAKGDYEVAYPLASDKKALRISLLEGLTKSLELNTRNADLLELDAVKIFEIGTIFPASGEKVALSIGVKQIKKEKGVNTKQIIENALTVAGLQEKIGEIKETPAGAVIEINLSDFVSKIPAPEAGAYSTLLQPEQKVTKYTPFSAYPCIVRDIAAFVPSATQPQDMEKIIIENGGALLVKRRLVDVFEKKNEDGTVKKSLAFRLVFQANDRTLTDEEVNSTMEKIYGAVKGKGWEAR